MFNCVEENLWCNSPFAEQKYKHARGHTLTLMLENRCLAKSWEKATVFHWNKSHRLIITHHARAGACFRAYKPSQVIHKNNVILITLINKKKSTIMAEPLYFWRHSTSHARIQHCNPFMFLCLYLFCRFSFVFKSKMLNLLFTLSWKKKKG